MARKRNPVQEHMRLFIWDLISAIIDKHFDGLQVEHPQDGEPFGVGGMAIPVYRLPLTKMLAPRYIFLSDRELRMNHARPEKLAALRIKQFLKSCPKSWITIKKAA